MLIEWLVIVILLLGAVYLVYPKGALGTGRLAGLSIAAAGLPGVWLWQDHLQQKINSAATLTIPHVGRADEYAGSASCRACHPDQYASWHQSFHRTMTQVASPESIRGNFDGVDLTLDGEVYRLQRRGGEFWVEMVDPDWKMAHTNLPAGRSEAPRSQCRISMVTGSHQMQAYWLDNGHGNRQFSFPFTYLFEQERWVPRRCVFIKDPKVLGWRQVWNIGCVDCHSTAGQPGQREDLVSFDTRVAEFGISCEACHGPAADHVRRNANPWRRYALHLAKQGDKSIVNPSRLSSKRASEICGRCHSVHVPLDEDNWLRHGESFHPGEELAAKLKIVQQKPGALRSRTSWSDGMVRVSGREYNGLIKSPCFERGEMSCMSCHSMHSSSPTNQVAQGMEGNAACLQCHQSLARNLSEHTHHAAASNGSLCYNCHMPYTTYGLLRGIRSHQISSPNVKATLQTGRPNACNLCHLDKTLDWTAQNLARWYQTPVPGLSQEDQSVAASILWALKGEAGQRALVAWHMGWPPARAASGTNWFAPYLATLLEDPYPAVRCIAERSLKRLPGFADFSYDYATPSTEEWHAARERALRTWKHGEKRPAGNACLLLEPNGDLRQSTLETLLLSRDNRTVILAE